MKMNINLDKFWEFVKTWSVGRLTVLLVLLGEIILKSMDKIFLDCKIIFAIIAIAILLEIFELSHNKLNKESQDSTIRWMVFLCMLIPILGILAIIVKLIFL
jgi:hypothetical protein